MPATVVVARPRPGIVTLTLTRPDRLNAMTADLVQELHDALDGVHADPDCRVVVLTGAGRAFCAGLDLNGYGTPPHADPRSPVAAGLATQRHIAGLIPHLRATRQPVIAAVNGAATGGGLALVLGSDIRLASTSARFGAAFVKVGLSACDIGTSWLLPRLVGVGRAHELMLTGRVFDAEEAVRIGLVVEVVADGDLLSRAYEEADLLMENAPFGVEMTKETMWASVEIPGVEAAINLENRTQIMCMGAGDHTEAVAAFLEKRPPRWAAEAT
ncbi:MAG: enoyl-CoA hydratase/isomerase family protein [Acidimicrobiales bacterium]